MTQKITNLIKDIFLFILIIFLLLLPILKQFLPITMLIVESNYLILQTLGILGLYFLVINIYINFEKNNNKKIYLKNLIPIFILVLYMLWTFISSFNAENKHIAFNGTEYRKEGYFTYLAYAGIFGLAFCINSEKLKKILLYLFLIIALLSTIFAQFAEHGYFNHFFWSVDAKTASFFQFNHYGYYLLIANAIACSLFITEKNKFFKILNLIIYSYLLYYLIFNDTFGCYLALILDLIIFLIFCIIKKYKKISIIILISTFILISVFSIHFNNYVATNITVFKDDIQTIISVDSPESQILDTGTHRMGLWINGIKFFIKKPILGYGPEQLENKYTEVGISQDRPHNLLIQLATTSGFPGLILYISSILIILLRSFKIFNIKNLLHTVCMFSSIAYLISSMFGNSMYYTSPYFFLLLGFLFNELLKLEQKQET